MAGGAGAAAARRELKQLVKALHSAGIEVLLDLVYNHTNEGAPAPPPPPSAAPGQPPCACSPTRSGRARQPQRPLCALAPP